MDGTVVRWYANAQQVLSADRPTVSASRNGVLANGYLHEIPPGWLTAATDAFEALRRDHGADCRRLATHRIRFDRSRLEPVAVDAPVHRTPARVRAELEEQR